MNSLFDPIRGKSVADTPEERVRQSLIHHMLGPLGFPRGLLSIEKKLSNLCSEAAMRRIDLVAFMKREGSLLPLLLVECKARVFDETVVFRQAFGYNASLAAPFCCLAHEDGIRTYWFEAGELRSVPFLPPYQQLISRIV